MNWKNQLTQLLQLDYPIIQAPMYGVSTPQMVASAAKAGCLGSLALGDLPAEKCIEQIQLTKKLCKETFAVNIFVHEIPTITEDLKIKYNKTKQFIEQLSTQYKLEVHLPAFEDIQLSAYHNQVDALIDEDCKIVSFTFGNLDDATIQKFKAANTILIGTCTSVAEAKILESSGIDIICVQGIEAGGHRGSFNAKDIPEIGGFSLLAQVCEQVSIPIIYAGGIYNAKTLLAAKALGAQGFQLGSAFIASTESALKQIEKDKLKVVNEKEIVLTNSFSGRYARGIKNAFSETLEGTDFILPYPYQNKLTGELRKIAKQNENLDFVSIWLGQSIHNFSTKSVTEILKSIITETEKS